MQAKTGGDSAMRVADEVPASWPKERTSKATGEITAMVSAIQEGTGKAVLTMQQGVARAH